MKHFATLTFLLLAACASTATDAYDIQSFEDSLAASPGVDRLAGSLASQRLAIPEASSTPSGFVSLFEAQPDGTFKLRLDQ